MKSEYDYTQHQSSGAGYTIYTDGGARGNPGPAAYGFVINDSKGSRIYEEGRTIGNATNNVAEYSAVIAALRWLASQTTDKRQLTTDIRIFLDSQLAAQQLSGRWKIKNERLRNLYFTIKELEQNLGVKVIYQHVVREKNLEADRLVNLALDAKL